MPETSAIHDFLREAHVPYAVMTHPPAFTAQEEAAATHVPGRNWAKVVVCLVDGEPVQAVLPATTTVNLDRLLELTGGGEIRLAEEDELGQLFPDCEPGADAAVRAVVWTGGFCRRVAGGRVGHRLQRWNAHGRNRDALGRLCKHCQPNRGNVRSTGIWPPPRCRTVVLGVERDFPPGL